MASAQGPGPLQALTLGLALGWATGPSWAQAAPSTEPLSFFSQSQQYGLTFESTSQFNQPEFDLVDRGSPQRDSSWVPRWLRFNPDGVGRRGIPESCHLDKVREAFQSEESQDPQAFYRQTERLKSFWQRCEPLIREYGQNSLRPLLKYSLLDYRLRSNPHVRAVTITLQDEGRSLRGFLALKPDDRPRPLVISQCGLYCNAEESTTHLNAIMHLFDESPFHILTLANQTGSDFVRDNQAIAMGGFSEGRQLLQIARYLNSPDFPFRHRISSLHVVGFSLGGHAALYASLYNSLNHLPSTRPIQSVMAYCPVVDLEKSTERLFARDPIGRLTTFWTLRQISKVVRSLPSLADLLNQSWFRANRRELFQRISQESLHQHQEWLRQRPWDLRPFEGIQFRGLQDYWWANNFVEHSHLVSTPTLVLAAQDDVIVHTRHNARLLDEKHRLNPNSSINVLNFSQGNHCAFSVANGWTTMSTLAREYILSHSPEFEYRLDQVTQRVDNKIQRRWPLRLRMWPEDVHVQQRWQAKEGSSRIRLTFEIFSPYLTMGSGDSCLWYSPDTAPWECYRYHQARIPLSELIFPHWLPQGTPQSKWDAERLSRYANTNFVLLGADGQPLNGRGSFPTYVRTERESDYFF